ncbi:MAG: 3-oxoacyl-ACP synthase, partial [Acidimicrobiia bacterium]|nr:3-oxoacyl-ACP synthase [Acidimicrobiia bacterium]
LYGLDLADALLASDRADTVVVVGAEVHRGYMPFGASLGILLGTEPGPATPEDYERATASRAWSVLFGDGAGAVVLRRGRDGEGVLVSSLHTDGSLFDLIHVPGVGFVHQPYVSADQLEAELHQPHMNGAELFRNAVRLMPESIRIVLDTVGLDLADLDLVLAHQANQRILDGVAGQLGATEGLVASNIAHHGNTTAATLPLLYDECRRDGRTPPGALLAFTAFGAGAHWGALLYREPAAPVTAS